MARIAGVDLPREKKVEIGLTYIFGIGRALARRILQTTGVNSEQRVRDLSDADTNKLRQAIEKDFRVEGALRTEVAMTSSGSWTSARTAAFVTAADFRFVDSARTPTPAPRRAHAAQSPARRK